jgi:hypothetical protein
MKSSVTLGNASYNQMLPFIGVYCSHIYAIPCVLHIQTSWPFAKLRPNICGQPIAVLQWIATNVESDTSNKLLFQTHENQ